MVMLRLKIEQYQRYILEIFWIILLDVYECLACMHICVLCMCLKGGPEVWIAGSHNMGAGK